MLVFTSLCVCLFVDVTNNAEQVVSSMIISIFTSSMVLVLTMYNNQQMWSYNCSGKTFHFHIYDTSF